MKTKVKEETEIASVRTGEQWRKKKKEEKKMVRETEGEGHIERIITRSIQNQDGVS